MTSTYDEFIKIVIVGNSGTGKSSILKMYCEHEFEISNESTIGVEFRSKYIEKNGKIIKFHLWDTAGKRRFRDLVSSYYHGCNFFLLVFDLTDITSFNDIDEWIDIIKYYIDNEQQIILVGNKTDKLHNIPKEAINKFSNKHKFEYHEVSAKKNINIDEMFKEIAENFIGTTSNNSMKSFYRIQSYCRLNSTDGSSINCWRFIILKCSNFLKFLKSKYST